MSLEMNPTLKGNNIYVLIIYVRFSIMDPSNVMPTIVCCSVPELNNRMKITSQILQRECSTPFEPLFTSFHSTFPYPCV